jgi:nucleotide-binding universal stress UspA family protein
VEIEIGVQRTKSFAGVRGIASGGATTVPGNTPFSFFTIAGGESKMVERRITVHKRILVPLDGSARAERSIPVAAHIARATDGTVVLLRIATLPFTYSPYLGSARYADEVIEADLNEVETYLNALANSEPLVGIKTITKAILGSAAPEILSTAKSYNIDLIVMTSQGNTGMKRWILGSVAQKIARYCAMPVLVLLEKGSLPVGPHLDTRPLRALVPLDGSTLARAAIEPAAQLVSAIAAPGEGSLHLMRVVKPPTTAELRSASDHGSIESLEESKLHRAKTYLKSIADHLHDSPLPRLNLAITWSVAVAQDVAHAIIQMAENGEDAEGAGAFGRCDLIAIATHGRGGLQHWVMGSITERVLGATRLPILIVRPEPAELKHASSSEDTGETPIPVESTSF